MNVSRFFLCLLFAVAITAGASAVETAEDLQSGIPTEISLPEPDLTGEISLEQALAGRRSIRSFAAQPLTLAQAGQLLWAAQGVTGRDSRFRTAPSAGALCPLEIYLVAANVDGLTPGVYQYIPDGHMIALVASSDVRETLAQAALGQDVVRNSQAVIAISAIYERNSVKYGERSSRYVPMDAGHASQNVQLQAVALGLGTCAVGGFYDDKVSEALFLTDEEVPLLLIPVGVPE